MLRTRTRNIRSIQSLLRQFYISRRDDGQLWKCLNQIPLDVALRLQFLDREDDFRPGESQFESVIRLRFEFVPSVHTNKLI